MKYLLITILLFAGACKKLNPPPEYVEISKYIIKGINFNKDPSDVEYIYVYDDVENRRVYYARTKDKLADITSLKWEYDYFMPKFIQELYIAREYPNIITNRRFITKD